MIQVYPKVYLLAAPQLRSGGAIPGVRDWLEDVGGVSAAECLNHVSGSDAERLIELAARRCYKSFAPGLNPNVSKIRTDSADYHRNILESAHGSVLEHANVTWAFEFVSRVFTHELVRHRVGVAYSQESLRYVRLTNLGFRIPKCIAEVPAAKQIFEETVAHLESCQEHLAQIFGIQDEKKFATKKILTSAFRRIAPIGLATGIVMTCNFRTLRWLLEHRTTQAAEEEIREVFYKVGEIAIRLWPMIFGDFEVGGEDGRTWTPKFKKV